MFSSPAYIDPLSSEAMQSRPYQGALLQNLFNLYRLAVAIFFVATYFAPTSYNLPEIRNHTLFIMASWSYLGFAVINNLLVLYRVFPVKVQVLMQGLVDISALTLLLHASTGMESGIGVLLIIAIIGGSALTEGRTAVFFAAIATLALLGEMVYIDLNFEQNTHTYTQAGILGMGFFATAVLSHILAQRIRDSEALARQRGLHVEYLSQLNAQIVEHIRSGIIVIDVLNRIRLLNRASQKLLCTEESVESQNLDECFPELAEQVSLWRRGQAENSLLFRPEGSEIEVIATFTRLNRAGAVTVLILLEDATHTKRQAEQLKLASLGRLTASIAHEVRNPLAAINQAAQLLIDSPDIVDGDKRMSEIIIEHSRRVNTIVENVLQLSRQREANMHKLTLAEWLGNFIAEFTDNRRLAPDSVRCEIQPEDLRIYFDPVQLHQVLWNLCENALRYSQGAVLLNLQAGLTGSGRPFLDIQDYGCGIPEEAANHVFEPFFTTEAQGTGLGLFLAREICAANQSTLELEHNSPEGVCFRIRFAIPAELEAEHA